jgi:K+-transporting ATPase ATPase C chain
MTIALRTTLFTFLVTGILYPLATTGVAQLLFPRRAQGSLVTNSRGTVVGSELISQAFAGPAYLTPRPSANGYDGANSGGSNLGPSSRALRERVAKSVAALVQENPDAIGPVEAELVTASASGLDPHLSPSVALWQVPRIARARGISEERIRAVIEAHVEKRDLSILGEPRVNVLLTNLALDRQFGR